MLTNPELRRVLKSGLCFVGSGMLACLEGGRQEAGKRLARQEAGRGQAGRGFVTLVLFPYRPGFLLLCPLYVQYSVVSSLCKQAASTILPILSA